MLPAVPVLVTDTRTIGTEFYDYWAFYDVGRSKILSPMAPGSMALGYFRPDHLGPSSLRLGSLRLGSLRLGTCM